MSTDTNTATEPTENTAPKPKKKLIVEKKATVADLEEKKEGKKVDKTEIYVNVAGALANPANANTYGFHGETPSRFVVVQSLEKKPLIATLAEDNVVKLTCYEHFAQEVIAYALMNSIALSRSGVAEVYSLFCAISPKIPVDQIRSFATDDYKGFAFNRVAVDINDIKSGVLVAKDTPLFDSFLNRIVGQQEFLCFLGSLFFPDSSRYQYLWLHGEGGDGKSTVFNIIGNLLGGAASNESLPTPSREHFWAHRVVGKRLICFPDVKNTTFVQGQLFKMLTGEKQISVEEKGVNFYTTTLETKFMFGSNRYPEVANEKSELRRAIICHIKPLGKEVEIDPDYHAKISVENIDIAIRCIKAYIDSKSKIIQLTADTKNLQKRRIAENEQQFWAFFEKHADFKVGAEVSSSLLYQRLLADRLSNQWYNEFCNWLRKRPGVKRRMVKGRVSFTGIALKVDQF